MRHLTGSMARRLALHAQGLARTMPTRRSDRRAVDSVVKTTNLLQIDAVSAVVRAHYAPVFSRTGGYDTSVLDDAVWSDTTRSPRRLVEYWAHEAAMIPVEDWPLMKWRMALYENGRWGHEKAVTARHPFLADEVLAVITSQGPSSARDIEGHLEHERVGKKGPWWDDSDVKVMCEKLFATGVLSTDRRAGFTRQYDLLTERVLPASIVNRQIDEADSVRELMRRAISSLGVGTEADLRDYYRLSRSQSTPALLDLVEEKLIEPVSVQGWEAPAFIDAAAVIPRTASRATLLCPFDPMIFFRPRVERLFGFHYRIEIYTPEHKRIHGYYVFPFLLGEELAARVDLRAVRAESRLHVLGAFLEPGCDSGTVVDALAVELRRMADWLGLPEIVVGERGDVIRELRIRLLSQRAR